jgi:hypothetical protein
VNASVGEERILNEPEHLTHQTTAHISSYTHQGQDG